MKVKYFPLTKIPSLPECNAVLLGKVSSDFSIGHS